MKSEYVFTTILREENCELPWLIIDREIQYLRKKVSLCKSKGTKLIYILNSYVTSTYTFYSNSYTIVTVYYTMVQWSKKMVEFNLQTRNTSYYVTQDVII